MSIHQLEEIGSYGARLGKMFLYLIHLLHVFYIKLFSESETIFTNDEQTFLRRLSFIFALFNLFEKYVN